MIDLMNHSTRVSDVLIVGYQNRRTRKSIADAIGANSPRALRNALNFDRMDGVTILPDGAGNYFIPDFSIPAEKDAAVSFWKTQRAEAGSILAAVDAMERGYEEWQGEQVERGGGNEQSKQ